MRCHPCNYRNSTPKYKISTPTGVAYEVVKWQFSYSGAIFTTLVERKSKIAFIPTVKNLTVIFYIMYIYIFTWNRGEVEQEKTRDRRRGWATFLREKLWGRGGRAVSRSKRRCASHCEEEEEDAATVKKFLEWNSEEDEVKWRRSWSQIEVYYIYIL